MFTPQKLRGLAREMSVHGSIKQCQAWVWKRRIATLAVRGPLTHSVRVSTLSLGLPGSASSSSTASSRGKSSSALPPMSSPFTTRSNDISTSHSSDSNCTCPAGKAVRAMPAAFAWKVAQWRLPSLRPGNHPDTSLVKRPPRSAHSGSQIVLKSLPSKKWSSHKQKSCPCTAISRV